MGGQTITTESPKIAGIKIQTSSYGQCIPWLPAGVGRVPGNLLWYGNFKANKVVETSDAGGKGGGVEQQSISYTYEAAMMVGLARGPIQGVGRVWRAKEVLASLSEAGLSLAKGEVAQPVWSWLNSYAPTEALGYSGLAHVYAQSYSLDSAASLPNHNFEINAGGIGAVPGAGTVIDGCPRVIVEAIATDTRSGASWPLDKLLGLDAYQTYCRAAGIWMSPVLSERRPAVEWLRHLLRLTNTRAAWTGSKLELVPLGDVNISAHGAAYVAERTPDFDLTLSDFAPDLGDPPVRVRRHQGLSSEADVAVADDVGYNVITLEVENRANGYAVEPVSRGDLAHIERFGRREKETLKAPELKDPAIAAQVAQQLLQDELAKRNRYEFTLTWRHSRLRPLRLVTLTEPSLDLNRTPVRILSVEEGEDRRISVVAEDAPLGIANAPRYGVQAGSGWQQDYGVAPGSVAESHIFEAPAQLAGTTGLEVWLAVRSPGVNWGGCRVWVSLDGDNYREIARIAAGARMGVLAGPVSGSGAGATLGVTGVPGQLLSGSAADAQALATLCFVDGTQPEYLAYETAILSAPGAYTLGGLVRGAYGSQITAHAQGQRFIRIDGAVAKSGPLDVSYIGKTIQFKFTSFNVFGASEESLADVSAVPYLVLGKFAQALPGVAGKGITLKASALALARAADGAVTPSSVTLQAELKGSLTGDVQWSIASGTAVLSGSGNTRTITSSSIATPTVRVRVQITDPVGVYADEVTIATVTAGAPGLPGGDGAPGDSLQVQYSNNGTDWHSGQLVGDLYMRQRVGSTAPWGPSITLGAQGQPGVPGDPGPAGAVYAQASLYQWASTQPGAPSGTSVYTWATGAQGSYSGGNSWQAAIPANPGTPGVRLWTATKQVTATGGTATTLVSWATGATVSAVTQNGSAGTQTAKAAVYKWAATLPAGPAGTSVYTWAAAALDVAPSGWSLTPGTAASAGQTLYEASVRAFDSASVNATTINWTTAAINAISYAGQPGVDGQAGASARVAYAVINGSSLAAAPATVQTNGNASFPPVNTWGGGETWQGTVPSFSANQAVMLIDGIYNPSTDKTTWNAPYLASWKVGSLSAISANLGSINAGQIDIGSGRFQVSSGGYLVARGVQILDDSGNVILGTKSGAMTPLPAAWVNPAPGWLNSNIKVGGRNILPGASNGSGWNASVIDGDTFKIIRASTTETGYIYSPYVLIPPNTQIALSFESKQEGSVGSCDLVLLPDNYGSEGLLSTYYPLSTEWTRQTFIFTTPATWVSPIRLRFDHNGGNGTSSAVCVRKVKLEYGNTVTDWTPPVEDVAAASAEAKTIANGAATNAASALSTLQTMRSNGFLDAAEKPALMRQWSAIQGENAGIVGRANAFGLNYSNSSDYIAYTDGYNNLAAYINGLSPGLSDTTSDTPITPAVDAAKWLAFYNGRQALLNSIAAVAGTRASWSGVNGRPFQATVRAQGNDATPPAAWWNGLRNAESGAVIQAAARGWGYVELSRSGVLVNGEVFDTYGSPVNAANFLYHLNNYVTRGNVLVVYTFDEPQTNFFTTAGLAEALYKHGASRAMLKQLAFRGAYLLVGIVGCGEGGGREVVSAGGADAWAELSFSIFNGALNISGGSGGAKSVRDLDYVGALDATKGATLGVDVGGKITPSNASTLIDNAALGSALIGELTTANVKVTTVSRAINGIPEGSAQAGARVEVTNNAISIYRANGTTAVRISA